MDEDAAELAVLRRRAYGPDADIDTDPAGLARLQELESRGRVVPASEPDADAEPATAEELAEPSPEPRAPQPDRRRRARRAALIAVPAVLLIAAALAVAPGEPKPAEAPDTATAVAPAAPAVAVTRSSETMLVVIPLDRSLARYVTQPEAPAFPAEGGIRWAQSIGTHYGWVLWLARSAANAERCILLEREGETYASCAPEELFLAGRLEVPVPYGAVPPDHRPQRMTAGQSIVYRWTPQSGVAIVLDEADITYFGDRD